MKKLISVILVVLGSISYAQTTQPFDSVTIKNKNEKVLLQKVAQKDLVRKMDSIQKATGDKVLYLEVYDKSIDKIYKCKYVLKDIELKSA